MAYALDHSIACGWHSIDRRFRSIRDLHSIATNYAYETLQKLEL